MYDIKVIPVQERFSPVRYSKKWNNILCLRDFIASAVSMGCSPQTLKRGIDSNANCLDHLFKSDLFRRQQIGNGIHFEAMTLDEAQRKKVAGWIAEGLKLSEIQNRIASEMEVRLTYMDVRLLVDDLKLTPKDTEVPKVLSPTLGAGDSKATPQDQLAPSAGAPAEPSEAVQGKVSVSVDQIARAGAVVSGKVTFTDGMKADWYFDQTGRLGLATQQPGYRPPAADLQQFQMALETELSRMGL
jgi:hypothetical protein